THLLYYLITTLVLPKTWPGIALHGSGAAVVVLDTDSRFDIPRLAQIMKQHISTLASKTTTAPSTVELEALLMDSLQHVHIFRPDSMASLLTTLDTLPAYLLASATTDTSTANTTTPPPHSSAQRRLGALILDSASAFFWSERGDVEAGKSAHLSSVSHPPPARGSGYTALSSKLRHLSRVFASPVLYTTWNLAFTPPLPSSSTTTIATTTTTTTTTTSTTSSTTANQPPHPAPPGPTAAPPSHLPHPWPGLPSLRLAVARKEVRKFRAGISAGEARAEEAARRRVVERGDFAVWRCGGGGGGGVRGAYGGGGGEAGFVLRITEDGVLFP
ncbi:hypothetical protein LTR28_003399, partial [Elasticomyces elasticus]